MTGFDIHEEHPRPHYLARLAHVKKVKIDYITNTKEPLPPFWRMKLPAAVFSFSIVLLLVALAVAAIIGVVLYRMSLLTTLAYSEDKNLTTSNAILLTTVKAASINLCLIVVFNWVNMDKFNSRDCHHDFFHSFPGTDLHVARRMLD